MIDWDKAEKFTADDRYFNISVVWIFYFRFVLKILYRARIPHEAVTLFSIIYGLGSAYFFYTGNFASAAIAFHLKDLFDACDGALARLTGQGHLAGRYLDSLGDFVSITAVIAAIALNRRDSGLDHIIVWAILAALSIFLQCSIFNFYNIKYSQHCGSERLLSRVNEIYREDISLHEQGPLTRLLHFSYIIIFSWQDRLVASIDGFLYKKKRINSEKAWYGSKKFMTALSPLCFGTHIFVIIIFALAGKPEFSFPFIAVIMNFYAILLFYSARGR